jgi:hypothetical protein
MFLVIISGILGFFVFDCYRIHSIYRQRSIMFITFSNPLGILVHGAVYLAAGILALFVNLDTIGRCCEWQWFPSMSQDMVGPLMRGFGIGLAGPAALSKGTVEVDHKPKRIGKVVDDISRTEGTEGKVSQYVRKLLMR